MKTKVARVCLDCGEIHELEVCPECLSLSWWYLDWWLRNVDPRKVSTNEDSALAYSLVD